jgi:hypothetical protein
VKRSHLHRPALLRRSGFVRSTVRSVLFALISYPLFVIALKMQALLVTMPLMVTVAFIVGFVLLEAGLLLLLTNLINRIR